MRIKMYTQDDMVMSNVVMAIIQPYSSEGEFNLAEYGKGFVPTSEGVMVFVDEKYIPDLEQNFKLEMDEYFRPSLVTKPGVNYEPPEEDVLLSQEQELEMQLRKIREEQYKKDTGMAPPEDEEAALAEIDREIANREA